MYTLTKARNTCSRAGSARKRISFSLIVGLFVFLWAFLIVRANTVFYFHDEIVTKWAYMINWNPFPLMGYIDANNHFVNSLLGGLFVRLFESDAMWIVRLPNLLAFPLFFWSIYAMRKFFERRVNFLMLLITLTCTTFLVEYFGFARGYGMSMAFLVLAIQQTLAFKNDGRARYFIISLIAWVFAVYSNLTLAPFALAGMLFLAYIQWRKRSKILVIAVLPALFLVAYSIRYSFLLKKMGKLYMGSQDGFFQTTVHNLTPYLWNVDNILVDILLAVLTLFVMITLVWRMRKSKHMLDPRIVYPAFLILAVLNIVGQNVIFGVNYPEDRAALYLIVFFFGGLSFAFDYWKLRWPAYPIIGITLFFFVLNFNVNKSILVDFEHFDEELLTKIPNDVFGIPPSTGGRYWGIDNELSRARNLPLRAFQEVKMPGDTLLDYIIYPEEMTTDLLNLYHPVYKDQISELTLFERNHFLRRSLIGSTLTQIDGDNEYFNLYVNKLDQPLFFRCIGKMERMNIFRDGTLIFSAEDSLSQQSLYYRSVPLNESCAVNEKGEIHFDFTFAMNQFPDANLVKVYLWNLEKKKQKGEIVLEVYAIP